MSNKKDIENAKAKVATKYGLGSTLVTGHKGAYWEEAMEEYAASRISELEAENEKNIKWANDAETRAVAADERIVELEAENKRLREEQRWIPVTERLPETSGDCAEQVIGLSSAPGTEVPYVVICVAFYDGHFYVLDTFSEIDFSEPLDVVEHQIKTITHWQPLPQPPKEQ